MGKENLTFATYIGQSKIIERVKVIVDASQKTKKALPHMLFLGGGGLGKTSLANVIAKETKRKIITIMGETIKTDNDILDIFIMLFQGDANFDSISKNPILFIDEVHGLTKKMQEALYTAMEDYIYRSSKKINNQPMTVTLHPFTIIGATTNVEKLTKPLLSRFKVQFELTPYTIEESQIIANNYLKSKLSLSEKEFEAISHEVALRSKGIGRIIINNSDILLNYITVHRTDKELDKKFTTKCFDLFGIDKNGLQDIDYRLLSMLYQYSPDTVGGKHLAAMMNYEISYIEEYIEPWLLELRAIARTPRGRAITRRGIEILKERNHGVNATNGIDVMDLIHK
jgi:Holliday junction DNA helicase RuvB